MAGIAAGRRLLHDQPDFSRPQEVTMFTLSIEHAISDFPTWKQAFDRFAGARANAGVRGERIRRLADDPQHLVIELDFDARHSAETFGEFLRGVVWASRDASPALAGAPRTRILEGC
jgi:hypothetical protein